MVSRGEMVPQESQVPVQIGRKVAGVPIGAGARQALPGPAADIPVVARPAVGAEILPALRGPVAAFGVATMMIMMVLVMMITMAGGMTIDE